MSRVPRLVTASILLLASAAAAFGAPVAKSERDLVVFCANLSPTQPGPAKAFYDFISFAGVNLAKTTMTPQYRKVHVVEKNAATREALWKTLQSAASASSVKAVDLIFISHGLTGSIVFSDGTVSMENVKNEIIAKITAAERAKLRVVFNTACYSNSHSAAWLGAGFKAASGSKKIYADSVVSYQPFLVAWSANQTFSQSVAVANAADPLKATDAAAKQVLKAAGWTNWNDVDSTRVVTGMGALRISTMP